MPQKIPLAIASLAAALTFAVALAIAELAPALSTIASTSATTAAGPVAADPPTIQIDTIYMAAPPPQQTVTVHKVIKTSGEDGSEHESEGND